MKVGMGRAMEVGILMVLLAMKLMLRVMVVMGGVVDDGGNPDG